MEEENAVGVGTEGIDLSSVTIRNLSRSKKIVNPFLKEKFIEL